MTCRFVAHFLNSRQMCIANQAREPHRQSQFVKFIGSVGKTAIHQSDTTWRLKINIIARMAPIRDQKYTINRFLWSNLSS